MTISQLAVSQSVSKEYFKYIMKGKYLFYPIIIAAAASEH